MICPKCNAEIGDGLEECPKCGIFFSKWKEREENLASGNLSRYAMIANATSSEFNWTILVLIATTLAAVFYIWGHYQE